MPNLTAEASAASPFHPGEQNIQARTGKQAKMEGFARRAIRSYMPDQHRDFFHQLPFMVVGAVDDEGWPWASLVSGRPGFVHSPNPTNLDINSVGTPGNPVREALKPGAPVGLLGIEMPTRRRNRMNGRISERSEDNFTVTVDQSFGNCPQYIQHRSVEFVREPGMPGKSGGARSFAVLDDRARALIAGSDAFFVSSYIQAKDNPAVEGVDVSHRGGRPGFVKVEENTLTIPDFPGNYLFNTLGNFLTNPKAGLVFVDFATGDLLMLTGTVELLWEDDSEVTTFKGAQRGWRFFLDHGVWLDDALPFRSELGEFSPNSLMTDTWQETVARKAAEAKRLVWRNFKITRTVDESSVIRSFYLEPVDGDVLLPFKPGQFLTIRITPEGADKPVIRTYTLSSAPDDPYYRISVKREDKGTVSKDLHEVLRQGDCIEARAPKGDFFIDAAEERPAVLMAGGVGITPMMSMARHIANARVLTRHIRPVTIFHSSQTTDQRAFAKDFRDLEKATEGAVRYVSLIGRPAPDDIQGEDYDGTGHITADVLRQTLSLDDYDFFLCGPPAFMQGLYDTLRGLGVRDGRIAAEAFGPASLKRTPDMGVPEDKPEAEADEAIVTFAKSGFEQRWNKGDETLLELAESHGLSPEFSCRGGSCGTCLTKLKSGKVAYRTKPTADHADDEVLICCAVPALGSDSVELDL